MLGLVLRLANGRMGFHWRPTQVSLSMIPALLTVPRRSSPLLPRHGTELELQKRGAMMISGQREEPETGLW